MTTLSQTIVERPVLTNSVWDEVSRFSRLLGRTTARILPAFAPEGPGDNSPAPSVPGTCHARHEVPKARLIPPSSTEASTRSASASQASLRELAHLFHAFRSRGRESAHFIGPPGSARTSKCRGCKPLTTNAIPFFRFRRELRCSRPRLQLVGGWKRA